MLARAFLLLASLSPATLVAQQSGFIVPALTLVRLRMSRIREDGNIVKELVNGTYFELRLTAGAHFFGTSSKSDEDVWLEIDSGETYYVACARGARSSIRLNCAPSNRRMFELMKEELRPLR